MDNRQGAKGAKEMFSEPSEPVDDLARRVIGAAIEVHRHLGAGFLESVYEEALAVELGLRRIPFARQPSVDVQYKGHVVGQGRPDYVVGGELVVEVKAVRELAPVHQAQVMSYLRAFGAELGLLLNFHHEILRDGIRRVVWSHRQKKTDDVHEPHEADDGFVVASGNSSVSFEAVKEELDPIA